MAINITIHPAYKKFTDQMDQVETSGNTIGECLYDLTRQFPAIKTKLFDKKGALLNFIEIYQNLESAFPNELEKPTRDGDEITITRYRRGRNRGVERD